METKKSKEANIEKMRFPIGLTALLFTGSIVLASFSFTSGLERDSAVLTSENAVDITFIEVNDKVEPPEEQPPQQDVILPPTVNIIIDSNKTDPPKPPIILPPPPPKVKVGPPIVVEPKIYEWVDVEATFDPSKIVGDPTINKSTNPAVAMQSWIVKNVKYPQSSIEMNEQGRVYLAFVVEIDGSISNIVIERGVSPDLDREAKRLLRNMPKWDPGEAKGKKVRTRCRLPINFTLN